MLQSFNPLYLVFFHREYRARICKRLRSPGIDSKELIPLAAWRADTITLFRTGPPGIHSLESIPGLLKLIDHFFKECLATRISLTSLLMKNTVQCTTHFRFYGTFFEYYCPWKQFYCNNLSILPLVSETTFSTQWWRFSYLISYRRFCYSQKCWNCTLFYNSVLIEISPILPCAYI